MIQSQVKRDITTENIGETTKMTVEKSDEVEQHIVKVLTENYKYPVKSHVREVVSNHWDANFMAGKPDAPIYVKMYRDETNQWVLETSDEALGMDETDFDMYYMKIGASNKRNNPFVIGGKGCGAKAILSYTDSYEVITRKNGSEYKFLVFKGAYLPEKLKIYEKETDKPNGVIVKVKINRWDESEFKQACFEQLCYFPTVIFQFEGDNTDYLSKKVFETDLFKWSELYPSNELHISLGLTHYEIDWKVLGISKINLPVAIKIPLDSGIDVFFNRESIIYNEFAKSYIKDKISKIADYFVEKYNSQQKDEYELLEVFDRITNSNKYVTLGNEKFRINDLLQYATIQPKELKIKGIDIMKPEFYYNKKNEYLDEYETLVDYNKGKWSVKHVKSNHGYNRLLEKIKHIEVDKVPTGLVKKFLLEKYTDNRVLFVKKVNKRRLGNIRFSLHNANSLNYTYILSLKWDDKQNWRNKINEFCYVEDQFKSKIINELNVENSNEYLNWLANYKEQQKLNRKSPSYRPSSNYKRLNKTAEDITIQVACRKDIGYGCKFVKKAVKITDLNKLHKSTKALHIYFPEEQKERAKEYYELLGTRYSVCILSPREIKRLPTIKNFMTEKNFIESTKFAKIMTSLKYEKAIDNFDEIYRSSSSEIIDKVLEKFGNQREILKEYTRKNGKNVPNNLLEELKEIAQLHNLYDHSLDDVYSEFVKNTEKYEFISCLKKPNLWSDEEVVKYRKLINSLLLIKQKYNNFEELEIEVKPKQEETILEEQLETV